MVTIGNFFLNPRFSPGAGADFPRVIATSSRALGIWRLAPALVASRGFGGSLYKLYDQAILRRASVKSPLAENPDENEYAAAQKVVGLRFFATANTRLAARHSRCASGANSEVRGYIDAYCSKTQPRLRQNRTDCARCHIAGAAKTESRTTQITIHIPESMRLTSTMRYRSM